MVAYTNCPDCVRKGVTVRGSGKSAKHQCKFCGWAVMVEGFEPGVVRERLRWKRANGKA